LCYNLTVKRKGKEVGKMMIKRDLTDGYTKVAENEVNDFYIKKVDKDWYVYTMIKGTDVNTTMAGFSTKKSATKCAKVWATWQK
jgi:hypothetical protein